MQGTKKLKMYALFFIFTLLITFVLLEIATTVMFGRKVFMVVEEDGFYYFAPNQYGWYSYKQPPMRVNNIGTRGEDIDINSRKKILFIGDSFTFGGGLRDDETFPYFFGKILEERGFENYSVVNAGVGGYGLDEMKRMQGKLEEVYRPDLTIVTIIEDDLCRKMDPIENYGVKNIWYTMKQYSSFVSFAWEVIRVHFVGPDKRYPEPESGKIFTESISSKILSLAGGKEKKEILFIFYEYDRTKYSEVSEKFCKENNLYCITNVPSILASELKEEEYYTNDGAHPSAKSNQVLANAIYEKLAKNRLLR